MGEINLDTARAAREEVKAERTFVFRGETFELPAELPYEVLEPIGILGLNPDNLGAIREVMRAILGQEAHDRFESLKPSIPDLNELVGGLFSEYGLGNLKAPGGDGGGLDPKSPPSPGQ